MAKFKTTIGLEIHVQLATKSKMFCRCDNDAHNKVPNTTVCPICLGMPGMLPVANKTAILSTIKTGLALNCQINKVSKFDRKHYFYPDLPKGYQISQYDQPLCLGGWLEAHPQNYGKKVRLNRIHLEEDAGKLIHKDETSFVDLNRAGTPLMEIVTEPDITSPEEAAEFLRLFQKIVRDVVKVSEASMEKGHLRCDANIDVKDETGKMSEIIEIKNLNSFRFVEKALKYEEKRLQEEYDNWPTKKTKATRGFDSLKSVTFPQRTKEEASDYRYFPEPDLPPIDTTKINQTDLIKNIGQSEEDKIAKLAEGGVAHNEAKILSSNQIKFDLLQKLMLKILDQKYLPLCSKIVVHNYFGFDLFEIKDSNLNDYVKVIKLFGENKINKNKFQQICQEIKSGKILADIDVEEKVDLEKIINEVIVINQNEFERYKNGDKKLLGYFIGQVMAKTNGKADPKVASEIIKKIISEKEQVARD